MSKPKLSKSKSYNDLDKASLQPNVHLYDSDIMLKEQDEDFLPRFGKEDDPSDTTSNNTYQPIQSIKSKN